MVLVQPVYDCLIRLAQPDALKNEEEVCLPTILCFTCVPAIQQHSRTSCLNLSWCFSRPVSGGLPGAAAASYRRSAGEGERSAHGRALLPAAWRLPAAERPQLARPPPPARDPRVPCRRLEPQRHGSEVLLQRTARLTDRLTDWRLGQSAAGRRASTVCSSRTFRNVLRLDFTPENTRNKQVPSISLLLSSKLRYINLINRRTDEWKSVRESKCLWKSVKVWRAQQNGLRVMNERRMENQCVVL